MNVHTGAFNLAIEGDSEVMGQDGLPSTRARGPVRGSGVFESEVVVYGLAQFRLVTQRLADDRPVAGQRVLRLTQRRELRTLATAAIARKRIRAANLTLSNYLFRLAVQSITTDIGINADFSCVLIKNR